MAWDDPIWRGSWAARVSALSRRRGVNGLRLAVGCVDGSVHVYNVERDGVTEAFAVETDSPVTGIVPLSNGGVVAATWSGMLFVE